jgi:predicted N-formylglutamate amidohydrolase
MGLLDAGDSQPVVVHSAGAGALFLFICDHAGREVPRNLDRLGLPESAFDLHIAWDIGSGALTRRLARGLKACCILQRYSRLVIDCNRDPERADAAPVVSDGIAIPGNAALSPEDRAARMAAIHAPYHAAIAEEIDTRMAKALPTVLVFMHSFTPRMAGLDRPWQFGVIHDGASPFSAAVLKRLQALPGVTVGDNQPYAWDDVDYSAPLHAIARGLDYLELEVRQDLIADEEGQARIAAVLKEILPAAAEDMRTAPSD